MQMDDNEAKLVFTSMVNGHLTALEHRDSYTEKVIVCLSTLCALMREFEQDWIQNDLSTADEVTQREAVLEMGQYCAIPVKTLNNLLRKALRYGKYHPKLGLFELIAKFHSMFDQSEQAWWLLVSYIFTAMEAVRATKPAFSCPFRIQINSKGVCRLIYQYRSGKTGRVHVYASRVLCTFSSHVNRQAITKLFADSCKPMTIPAYEKCNARIRSRRR